MIKGLYSAFTALEAGWRYQDVLANNIANVTTPGFKRELAAQQAFQDVLISRQAPVPSPLSARIQDVVGQIGTGTFIAEFATDFSAGAFQATGNELDIALERGFLAVQDPAGQVFYTRDGRLGRDAAGDLVTSHGYYILNQDGGHIRLPGEPVAVEPDGTITQRGQQIDALQVVDFAPGQLSRAGEGYFTAAAPGEPVSAGARQGYLEASNSNMVEELTTLLAVQRTFQANQTILSKLDSTLAIAAGQLGTVGGTA
jgi:flagellar basal-body rod protein FlgG